MDSDSQSPDSSPDVSIQQDSHREEMTLESQIQSRFKVATVLILALFNLTYYMDRFGIAGKFVGEIVPFIRFIYTYCNARYFDGYSVRSRS